MKKWMVLLGFAAFLAACVEDQQAEETKPSANPDEEFVGERADALSNQWTTIMGELGSNDSVSASIDYPDWFHGYTLELSAGEKVDFHVTSSAKSIVRVYGPATHVGWDGRPKFSRSIFNAEGQDVEFSQVANRAGIYMVLVGPKHVWRAQYSITTSSELRCDTNADCPEDMACEHNGVYCITTPCDVSYNVCVPRTACETDEDCQGEWCGYTQDGGRACKPYVAEGEQCGGFRMAHLVEQCPPDLICAAPYDIIADIPGVCAFAEVTVAELTANPTMYDGRVVLVRGALMAGHGYCTKMACPIENPCCNRCGAQMLLTDSLDASPAEGIEFLENGATLGCSGSECDYMDACNDLTGKVWTVGVFRHDAQFGSSTFESARRYVRP